MALSLTCACGARFELEDTLAGQTITCPECQQPLKAPSLQTTAGGRRTNLLALLSAGMALMGAFTPLVGQAAAVVLGSMALVRIKRNPDREAGAGLALFGIIAGLVFGTLMVFALFAGEFFGVAGWLRGKTLGDQVDTTGSLEFVDRTKGFSITRPSRKWGVALNNHLDDPTLKELEARNADVMLVSLTRPVFIDVQVETVAGRNLDDWETNLLDEWRPDDPIDFGGFRPGRRNPRPVVQHGDNLFLPKLVENSLRRRPLEVLNGKGRELEMDVLVTNQPWHVLIRLYSVNQKLYVVRAISQRQKNFKAAKPEIDEILDSFKIIPTR